MRIEEDTKLDFSDVLIRPKRSSLDSRKSVDVSREFTFKWSGKRFEGVPIIAANMDGVGTFAMAKSFIKDGNGLSVALHKHYPLEELLKFYETHGASSVWYSIGMVQDDKDKLERFLKSDLQKQGKGIDKICLDVANGYSEHFVDFVKKIRDLASDITIMAGNVVTGEIYESIDPDSDDCYEICMTGSFFIVDCLPCNNYGDTRPGYKVGIPIDVEDLGERITTQYKKINDND